MNVGELRVSAIVETKAVKQGADNFVNQLNRMDNATLRQIKNIGQLTAGYFTIAPAVMQFSKESVNAYLESETASKTLSAALKGNQEDIKRLTEQASELQTKTIFSDEQIMNAQAMFGFAGKNADEIQKLIPLVVNLGAAQERTGRGTANLADISKILARSTGEELGPRLEMLIGPLTENEKQMLKNADGMERINLLTEIMTKKFGDIGFQVDDTASRMRILQNQVDEFKEGFGKGMVDAANTGIGALEKIIGANNRTGISFNDLGNIISKSLIGPILNVADLLAWLESKYGETLNGIQQKIVGFVEYLQNNPVFKYLPGIGDIKLDDFRTQNADSNNGIHGVTGTGNGDRGKMYKTFTTKTKTTGTGSNNGSTTTDQEELNFIEKFRQKIAELEAEEASLTEQLKDQNLTYYEQVALLAELEKIQGELSGMRGLNPLDISGKTGDIGSLTDMVKGLGDDPRFIRAGKPFTGSKRSGPAEESAGMSLESMMQVAQNIHNILNQPLDNPFQVMQAMLQIAMQIGSLLNGGAAGGFLSFLGPIGMGIGLLGGLFGGLFGGSNRGGSPGSRGSALQRLAAMTNTFQQTGHLYDLPPQFTSGNMSFNPAMAVAAEVSINGRKVDNKFKEEINRDGLMLTEFNTRSKYK